MIISINKNKGSTIEHNVIIDNPIINNYRSKRPDPIDWRLREQGYYNEILQEDIIIDNCLKRNLTLDEILNKFIRISSISLERPTIRTYGHFSSLSSIRQKSETNDIACLELREKENLIRMAKQGYQIRVIISLQIELIISLGYNYEQCVQRSLDLCQTIKELEDYQNISIVFDSKNSLDSLWILDTIIMFKAIPYDIDVNDQTFNRTFLSSKREVLENEIMVFDEKFFALEDGNKTTMSLLNITSRSDFAEFITNHRLFQINKENE